MASSADRGLAFYADHDFSSNLIALLRRHGADVLMAQQDGYDQRPDPTVMDRATELGRVLLSHDKHMLAEAHRRQQAGQRFSGLIRVQQRDKLDPMVREGLAIIAELGQSSEFADRVVYLP